MTSTTVWHRVTRDIEEASLPGTFCVDFGWPDEEPLYGWHDENLPVVWPAEEAFGASNLRTAPALKIFDIDGQTCAALAPRWAFSAVDQQVLMARCPAYIPTVPDLSGELWNLTLCSEPLIEGPLGGWTLKC